MTFLLFLILIGCGTPNDSGAPEVRSFEDPGPATAVKPAKPLKMVKAPKSDSAKVVNPELVATLQPLLVSAVTNGNTTNIKEWIDQIGDVNFLTDGKTLLMTAAELGHKEAVVVLMDSGAQYHQVDKSGNDALALAIINGHSNVVDLLKSHHQQFRDGQGNTHLMVAAQQIQLEAFKVLLPTSDLFIENKDKQSVSTLVSGIEMRAALISEARTRYRSAMASCRTSKQVYLAFNYAKIAKKEVDSLDKKGNSLLERALKVHGFNQALVEELETYGFSLSGKGYLNKCVKHVDAMRYLVTKIEGEINQGDPLPIFDAILAQQPAVIKLLSDKTAKDAVLDLSGIQYSIIDFALFTKSWPTFAAAFDNCYNNQNMQPWVEQAQQIVMCDYQTKYELGKEEQELAFGTNMLVKLLIQDSSLADAKFNGTTLADWANANATIAGMDRVISMMDNGEAIYANIVLEDQPEDLNSLIKRVWKIVELTPPQSLLKKLEQPLQKLLKEEGYKTLPLMETLVDKRLQAAGIIDQTQEIKRIFGSTNSSFERASLMQKEFELVMNGEFQDLVKILQGNDSDDMEDLRKDTEDGISFGDFLLFFWKISESVIIGSTDVNNPHVRNAQACYQIGQDFFPGIFDAVEDEYEPLREMYANDKNYPHIYDDTN